MEILHNLLKNMAHFEGETSNQVFEVLEEWNTYLERHLPYYQAPEKLQP